MKQSPISVTGRRKNAVARIRLLSGNGKIEVNGRVLEDYFPVENHRAIIKEPLKITDSLEKFNVLANVRGGGIVGQAGAIRHGIARALLTSDESLKPLLKKAGFLRRDPRKKERKKYGQKGARRRLQWNKR